MTTKLAALILAAIAVAFPVHAAPLTVGETIPDVTLRTEADEVVKLRQLVAKRPTVLVFYRGGWCPFCTKHLAALAGIQDDLKAAGAQLLAVSIDQPSKLKATPKREQLAYSLLSDADATAAEAFGIAFRVPDDLVAKYKNNFKIDLEAASGRTHHKLPHPAVFVVNQKGVIRFAHVNEDYKQRLAPDKILEAARAAQK